MIEKKLKKNIKREIKKGYLLYLFSSILCMENEFVVIIIFYGIVYYVLFRFSVVFFFRRKMYYNFKKKSMLFLVNVICIIFCVVI